MRLSTKDHIPAKLIKKLDNIGIEIVLRDKTAHRKRQTKYAAERRDAKKAGLTIFEYRKAREFMEWEGET